MNHDIRHLRDAQLDPKLAFQLHAIIDSYRPHDDPPDPKFLGDRITQQTPLGMESLCSDVGIDYNKFKAKCKKRV
jgi:hypothetical protein